MKITRPMKLTLALVALALPFCGCLAPSNDSPIRLLGAYPLTGAAGACKASDVSRYAGNLDISSGVPYLLQFKVKSELESITTQSDKDVISGTSRNDFVLTELALSYTTTPALTLAPERVPAYLVLPAGSTADSWVNATLIGPKAAAKLADLVAPGDLVTVKVTIQLVGTLASGSPMKSNIAVFPIDVFSSGFQGCSGPGNKPVPTGACGSPGGQDGAPVDCCLQPNGTANPNTAYTKLCAG